MSKNLVPILTAFLIVLVLFIILQVVQIATKDPIPEATQKQIETLNPNLNTKVLEEIKTKSAN